MRITAEKGSYVAALEKLWRDERISLSAKGLMCQLLTRPRDEPFEVTIEKMIRQQLRELLRASYLESET